MIRSLLPLLGLLYVVIGQRTTKPWKLGKYNAVKMTIYETTGSASFVCLNNVQLFKDGVEVKYSATITGSQYSSYYPKNAHQGSGSSYWCSENGGFSSGKLKDAKSPEVLMIDFNEHHPEEEFDEMRFAYAYSTSYGPNVFTVHGLDSKTNQWVMLYDNKYMRWKSSEIVTLHFDGCADNMVYYNNMCYYVNGSKGYCVAGYRMAEQSVLEHIGDKFADKSKTYYSRKSDNCCVMHSKQSSEKQQWGATNCNAEGGPGALVKHAGDCKDQNKSTTYQLTLCYGGYAKTPFTLAPTGASCTLHAREHDTRNRCELYDSWVKHGEMITDFKEALGQCEFKEEDKEPRMVRLMRPDYNIMYLTKTPQQAFSGMMTYFRKYYYAHHTKSDLLVTYTHMTRDGKKRKFTVTNNMDLWSAFQMQEKHRITELYVEIDTTAPTSQPTTGHPTLSPSVYPTTEMAATIQGTNYQKDVDWLNKQLNDRVGKKMGGFLYRMSMHGKPINGFNSRVVNRGSHLCLVKRHCDPKNTTYKCTNSDDQVFGTYSDINWKLGGGWTACKNCFLFIIRDGSYNQWAGDNFAQNQYATYQYATYGPCFGQNFDFCINSPSTPSGYSNVGKTYKKPWGSSSNYRFGSVYTFYIEDWECYSVE